MYDLCHPDVSEILRFALDDKTILLGLAQGFDNELDLGRGEAAGGIRITDGTKVVHQVRIIVDPQHQFLSGGSGSDVRAIELCQLSFAVCFDFHYLMYDV